jgi:hypothetical protein
MIGGEFVNTPLVANAAITVPKKPGRIFSNEYMRTLMLKDVD